MKYFQTRNPYCSLATRRGLTVLELLVTITIVTLLLALLLPAIQSARESARNVQCQNNLRQIGNALHMHHDTFSSLPAGWCEISDTKAATGWIPHLLPFLEQTALQQQVGSAWSQLKPWEPAASVTTQVDSMAWASAAVLSTPAILICPSDSAAPTFQLFEEVLHDARESENASENHVLMELPHANYVGVYGVSDADDGRACDGEGTLTHRRHFGFRDLTRGLSNVAVVCERTARRLPSTWLGFHVSGEDAAGRVVGFAFEGPNNPKADECEFDSRHRAHVQMLFADGHVRSVENEIESGVYQNMARRSE